MLSDWGSDLVLPSHCAAFSEGSSLLLLEGFLCSPFQPKRFQNHRYFRSSFRFLHSRGQRSSVKVNLVVWKQPRDPVVSPDLKQCWEAGGVTSQILPGLKYGLLQSGLSSELIPRFSSTRGFFLRIPWQFCRLMHKLFLVKCFLILVVLHL